MLLGGLMLDDLELVELYTLRAALLNPQCHYDLAHGGSHYIPETDTKEYKVVMAYLEYLIERILGT